VPVETKVLALKIFGNSLKFKVQSRAERSHHSHKLPGCPMEFSSESKHFTIWFQNRGWTTARTRTGNAVAPYCQPVI